MPKGRNGKENRRVKKCRETGKRIQTLNNTTLLRRSGLPVDDRIKSNPTYDIKYDYYTRHPQIVTLMKMYENVIGDLALKRDATYRSNLLQMALFTYHLYTNEDYDKNEVVRAMIYLIQKREEE